MIRHARKSARLLAAMGLGFALTTSGYAVSGQTHSTDAQTHSHPASQNTHATAGQAAQLTQALVQQHRLWAQSQGSNRSRALAALENAAQERQNAIAQLLQTSPSDALRAALPPHLINTLPASVKAYVEQPADLEGTLEISYQDDFVNPANSRMVHTLNTADGRHIGLALAGDIAPLKTGQAVGVRGLVFFDAQGNEQLVADADNDGVLMLALDGGSTGGSNGGEPLSPYNVIGDQRTLVLLVNFQDKASEKPWTTSQVNSTVFGSVSNYFAENSAGLTTLSGDTRGWYTLPLSSTTCNNRDIAAAAKNAATSAGIDVSGYSRFLYVFPYTTACSWSGTALVGGKEAWINGAATLDVIAHEMGHNFGLHHAHSLSCSGSTTGDNCQHLEYGDGVDVMGWSYSSHFGAFNKEYLGWLNQTGTGQIQQVTASGTYHIEPYARSGTGVKALKIQKGFDQWGHPEWYYVEYRQPVGFDAGMTSADPANVMNGVIVRTGIPQESSNTGYLLDMTPETYDLYTRDPALPFGRSYTDAAAGFTISAVSGDASGATVTISMGSTQSCVRGNPGISFTPSTGPWVAAGSSVSYSVTVTNNDSAACSSNSFALAASKPSGWSAVLGNSSLSLAPGQSVSTTLTVTSANTAANGFYDIPVQASSAGYSASGKVTYVVDNPTANTAPVANNDVASSSGETVTISVLNNDSDADGDALSVSSLSGVNGQAVINSNGTISFTPANGFSGTETFSYTVSDGKGGSDSAQVSVTVSGSNRAPIALNDTATLASSSVTIAVMANDYDPEGDTLRITGVTQGSKGSVIINNDGTLTYIPGKRFKNGDSFSYTISDGRLSASASVTIGVSSSDSGSSTGGKGNGKNR